MSSSSNPYRAFKKKLITFADGQAGIRNPFVIAAVEPTVEHQSATRLAQWATTNTEEPVPDDRITIQTIWLDELLARTDVYKLCMTLGEQSTSDTGDQELTYTPPTPERIESTLQDQLAKQLVQEILENEVPAEKLETQQHILLLLHLGSLYPFTRASELLDELDRRNVKSTVGIPFPGDVVNGKLNFFGGDSRHYYPAHQISPRIRGDHLQ